MMGIRVVRVVVVMLVVVWSSRPSAADGLDRARAALDRSDYGAAREALVDALAAGSHAPDRLAEIHLLTGVVAAALDEPAAAVVAFKRCLAIAPATTLPAGTSPKIVRPFESAQAAIGVSQPIRINYEAMVNAASISVVIVNDPLAMIARIRVTVTADGAPEQTIDRPVAERVAIALPAGKRLELRIAALDAGNNHVAEIGSKQAPIVLVGLGTTIAAGDLRPTAEPLPTASARSSPPPPPPPPPPQRPLVLRWWLWGGAAIAFAGAGTYFGVDALRATDELDRINAEPANHSYDEFADIQSRGRRSAVLANIGLIAGGGFAVAATVLYLTAPRSPSERRITVRPAPVPGGATIVLGGRL